MSVTPPPFLPPPPPPPPIAGACIYRVGGAVRDALLGLPVQDNDWVVVGSTPEQMVAHGFRPVGKDFPVFLHPHTHEEYALARTERKSGRGYKGFTVLASPEVTLEQDLARRDLTINALAQAPDGCIIDPFGGVADLHKRVLRHVSPAFAEDPVRILRVARFAARLGDFALAPDTLALMQHMVQAGEARHLVPERVWQEISRGLMETHPQRMLHILRACGALACILPEVDALWGVPQRADYHPEIDTGTHLLLVLGMAAQLHAPLPVRYACLCHDLGKATTPADILPRHIGHEMRSVQLLRGLNTRLRVPNDCATLAETVAREHGNIHRSPQLDAAGTLRLLERCNALRQPERFAHILLACECDVRGRQGHEHHAYPQRQRLLQALHHVQRVDAGRIAQDIRQQYAEQGKPPANIGEAIQHAVHKARTNALRHREDAPT